LNRAGRAGGNLSAAEPLKGRGAASNPPNRFLSTCRVAWDDGWNSDECAPPRPATELIADNSRSVLTYNQSPDVPFDRSVNPYRGCEHGCIYCFARPTHAYLDCSPGLDFETRIFFKPAAAALLRQELARPGYRCAPLALGVNTDAYQPAERELRITRAVLEALLEYGHPVALLTKSALIERDLDLLGELAQRRLVHVTLSVTTLDRSLARVMEPRAAAPQRRLQTIARLHEAGIPVGVMLAPVIPALNDAEIETILAAARAAGALSAGYVLLRLPHEVKDLFREWLQAHRPLQAERVMARIRDVRGGRENDSRFGSRMRGQGEFARLIEQRFSQTVRRLNFPGYPEYDLSGFRAPRDGDGQLALFD
jgi:DNA repair photolyase